MIAQATVPGSQDCFDKGELLKLLQVALCFEWRQMNINRCFQNMLQFRISEVTFTERLKIVFVNNNNSNNSNSSNQYYYSCIQLNLVGELSRSSQSTTDGFIHGLFSGTFPSVRVSAGKE